MKTIKQLWELLCVCVLGVPMMVAGYFGTYLVFGVLTGYRLYTKWHRSDETSP